MCFQTKNIIKEGVLYQDIVPFLRPFDIILLRGYKAFSKLISLLEKRKDYPDSGEFTHAGIILTSDVIDHPNMKPGRFYLYESVTANGSLDYGVGDIDGNKWKWGVQIRDLEELVTSCDRKTSTTIAYCRLIDNPIERMPLLEIKNKFNDFYLNHINAKYDMNLYSLFASVFPFLRKYRDSIENFTNTSDWLFCSELVAMVLKYFNVYPPEVNPKDVLPRDIAFPEADTDPMPKIISNIIHITTPLHYNGSDVVIL
jgi:hypothetical protein